MTLRLVLLFSIFLFPTCSYAQLTANAGPDISWCAALNADTPAVSGASFASGGVPPYSYSWKIRNYIPPPVNATEDEYWLLDSPSAMHPHFIKRPYADSIFIYLEVKDATNNKAYDTAILRLQKVVCALGTIPMYKNANDTISLGEWQCTSNFLPYASAIWTPSTYLQDSTVLRATCFAPVNISYSLKLSDRTGCAFYGGICHVLVNPNNVQPISIPGVPRVYLDGDLLNIFLPERNSTAHLELIDLNGRKVSYKAIQGINRIDVGDNLANGIYGYRLTYNGKLYQGKVTVHK